MTLPGAWRDGVPRPGPISAGKPGRPGNGVRSILALLLLSAAVWGGMPAVPAALGGTGGAALADDRSHGGSHDNDHEDNGDENRGDQDGGNENGGDGSGGHGPDGSGGRAGGDAQDHDGFGRDGITIRFSDGHVERVRDGRFESLDPQGRVIASFGAQGADVERLKSLEESVKRRGGSQAIEAVVVIGDHGSAIELTDYRGWREIVAGGAYVVKDPTGRTVIRRPATADDITRLRGVLRLD